ncbi:DUF6663 family protein [Halapricum desulfuricans]|uniref:Uncharacterized protein n=1 Tax=Halapricum desulfuricans TaxID=2841257 RepID=A0A897NCV6_9EURY|nr:DUF6663 family protein [Halapricum desulfuricans]QSG08226.1 Uncharacterized protein HSR122_0822 [Halapricum desulfuricans]
MDETLAARVLPDPDEDWASADRRTVRLLDRDRYEPVEVLVGDGEELRPGYLIDADIEWSEPARLEAFSLRRPTLYAFADAVDPVFEVARDLWETARANGDGMHSSVTRNTDGEVNGVCYVFADGGAGDRFREFRDGTRPLEPLVDRVNEREGAAPREVFVLRPDDGGYVVVTIALTKGGHFAETLRDTYGLDRSEGSVV